jgi:hypothetical protein
MTIQLHIDGTSVKEIIIPEENFDYMATWSFEDRCAKKEEIVRKHLNLLKTNYHEVFTQLGHHVQYVVCATSKPDLDLIEQEEQQEYQSIMKTI